MDADRWARIEQLCQQALECPQNEQGALLSAACANDDGLRREVESLLAYRQKADYFMETPALELAAKALARRTRTNSSLARPKMIFIWQAKRSLTTAFSRNSAAEAWASCIRRKTFAWTILWPLSFCRKRFLMTFERLNSSSGRRARPRR